MEGASGVFGNGKEQKGRNDAALVARLYQEIGQLKVERDFLAERVRSMSPGRRRKMVDREHPSLPIVRQCALLGVSRSSLYYRGQGGFRSGPVPDGRDGPAVPGDPILRV